MSLKPAGIHVESTHDDLEAITIVKATGYTVNKVEHTPNINSYRNEPTRAKLFLIETILQRISLVHAMSATTKSA